MTAGQLTALVVFVAASNASAADSDRAGINRAFRRMKSGIRLENELRFKSGWYPMGYDKNLVGGRAGMSGRGFYRQGLRRRWILQPKLDRMRRLPGRDDGPWVVPCLIWSSKRNKAIATIYALMIHNKKRLRWQMLGGGGRRADVVALGARYVAGEIARPKPRR